MSFSIPSLSVYMCSFPKVSCRQYIVWSCFSVQPATIYLLIEAFSPLAFKVIIDKYVFIAILNLVFHLTVCFPFVPFFSFFYFSICCCCCWMNWFPFILCSCPLLFGFCKCSVCFSFVIAMFFKYINPFLYLLALD